VLVVVCLALAGGCARQPVIGVTSLKVATLAELQGYLLEHEPDLDQFRSRGPFAVAERKNHEIRLSATERVSADLYLSAPAEKASLVIILHGHDNSKEHHAYQAMHVASWGMHALTLQLPNSGPWVANGRILARLVNAIHHAPEIVDSRIDVKKIILVGHSFGGTAVAVALGEGAPAAGGVLLDAAAIGRELPGLLKRINTPVLLIGADEENSPTRNRGYFFQYIPSGIAEFSIRGANHEDAQFPVDPSLQAYESDPAAAEESQIAFVSALTAAAFSLAATGKLDYAWASFGDAFKNGKFFNVMRK
jgi:pimeloyl-ACP methyl ester carboxylesterase